MSNLPAKDAIARIGETMISPAYKAQIAQSIGVSPDDPIVDRFTRVALRAVQEDPKLLDADRNSLYLACQAAAVDNLMPDGRDGKLVVYNAKVGEQWVNKVQWQRMIGGLRKLAVRGGFDLLAYPVHENDSFRVVKGASPRIEHEDAALDKDPGNIIGFYAIATNLETGKQYFEVMRKTEVDKVAQASKSKDKSGNLVGPWRDWYGEQGRKTVAKRLFKSLPLDERADALAAVVARDNQEYGDDDDVDRGNDTAVAPATAAVATPLRPRGLQKLLEASAADLPAENQESSPKTEIF